MLCTWATTPTPPRNEELCSHWPFRRWQLRGGTHRDVTSRRKNSCQVPTSVVPSRNLDLWARCRHLQLLPGLSNANLLVSRPWLVGHRTEPRHHVWAKTLGSQPARAWLGHRLEPGSNSHRFLKLWPGLSKNGGMLHKMHIKLNGEHDDKPWDLGLPSFQTKPFCKARDVFFLQQVAYPQSCSAWSSLFCQAAFRVLKNLAYPHDLEHKIVETRSGIQVFGVNPICIWTWGIPKISCLISFPIMYCHVLVVYPVYSPWSRINPKSSTYCWLLF